jgi:hypothetical protein
MIDNVLHDMRIQTQHKIIDLELRV